jgi:hypothetical protein
MQNNANVPYHKIVGNIMYVIVAMRPNLAMAMGVVYQFMHGPQMDN